MAYGIPEIDFSPIGRLPDVYAARQERERANAFAQGVAGLPRGPNGEIDMNAAIALAARTGNIRSLRDLIATQGIYSEQQAMKDAAGFSSLFGGVGQPPQPQPAQPPAQNMIPGNRAPILDATGFRTTQAEPEVDVPIGTERPMQAAAATGAASASGLPYDFGSATFTSEPKTRLAYGTDGTTVSDALPPVFNKTRIAQAGGGAVSGTDPALYGDPRPVRTESIRPTAPATTGQRQQQQPIIPSLSDPSMVPRVMAALRSRKLPEGQRQAAMLYLKNIFEADNPTSEMRNLQFIAQNPHLKELYLELKRASSPQTNLTTVEGFENARLKAQLGLQQKEAEGLQTQVASGRRVLPLIDHIMRIADSTPQGWAGSITPAIARGLSALGVPVTEGMANAEAFAAVSRYFLPAVREPGPTSQQEGIWYFEAVPGLMQSGAGRKKIAEITRRMINHTSNLYNVMEENLGNPEYQKKVREASERPLFSQAEYEDMERIIKDGGAQPPEHRPLSAREYINLPRPQSRAEYDALPVGTKYVSPDGITLTKKPPRKPDL